LTTNINPSGVHKKPHLHSSTPTPSIPDNSPIPENSPNNSDILYDGELLNIAGRSIFDAGRSIFDHDKIP
jgi:hypothetical protein